jgi:hypothetical protein
MIRGKDSQSTRPKKKMANHNSQTQGVKLTLSLPLSTTLPPLVACRPPPSPLSVLIKLGFSYSPIPINSLINLWFQNPQQKGGGESGEMNEKMGAGSSLTGGH